MNHLLVFIGTLCFSTCVGAAPPNVLFIAVDDLRPELGCYGADHIHSPNIDRLAQRGLLFERAYCQVAVCNPSRNSVLSGCRPDTTRIYDNSHFLRQRMADVVTLPQLFKKNGYTSISIGKIFHHSDLQLGDDPQSWSEPAWYHGPDGKAYTYAREMDYHWFSKEARDFVQRVNRDLSNGHRTFRGPPYDAADEPDDRYLDAQTAAQAIKKLGQLKAQPKPFFLAVGFMKPHLPFTCPQKYWDLYPADAIKLPEAYHPPENAPTPALHNAYELRGYGKVPPKGAIPDELALNLIRGYRACVSFVDAQVGRVLDDLDRLGLRDNTIVVLWSDHGYNLGENGVFTKMTNFELGARVPLIISLPQQKSAGRRTRALVELVDLYPTLAELCELPLTKQLEGLSMKPLLVDPSRPWKTAAFSQYLRQGRNLQVPSPKDQFMGRSIRTQRWRYTEWKDRNHELAGVELYDHHKDASETTNIAADPAVAETVLQLARQLENGWKKVQLTDRSRSDEEPEK